VAPIGVFVDQPDEYVRGVAELVGLAAVQRAISIFRSLLRARLGNRVNVMILDKALTLELRHFEDSEIYDKMSRARREASSRPLSLVCGPSGPDGIRWPATAPSWRFPGRRCC
jgi:ATP-binding cassette subfamily B protein